MRWITQNITIVLILVVGAVLRFYHFTDLPFVHDELSALLRTQFSNLGEVIDKGVRGDGHPAGIQLLLWVWTGIGGFQPWWVKLPFALAGVWSIWLVYIIGRRIITEEGALVAAALFATLQFSITYSQWARPYSIGLALTLAAFWSLLRFRDAKGMEQWKYLFAFSLAAAGTAYTHYFALLQVLIMSVCFLPLLTMRQLLLLSLSGALALALWFPHLDITMAHLDMGGIGHWLQAPENDFWWTMMKYAFQFSMWPVALLLAASLATLVRAREWMNYRIVYLVLAFVLPYLITYFYSLFVNPVLQHSTLIFAFPFFLLSIAHFVRLRKGLTRLFLILIMALNIGALVDDREHYTLNYQHEFNGTLEWLHDLQNEGRDMDNIVHLRKDAVEFLMDQEITQRSKIRFYDSMRDSGSVVAFLDTVSSRQLFVALTPGTEPELLSMAMQRFPCILEARYFHTGEAYLLGTTCDSRIELPSFQLGVSMLDSIHPYSPSVALPFSQLDANTNTHIEVFWSGNDSSLSLIVVDALSNSGNSYWHGTHMSPALHKDSLLISTHSILNSEFDWDANDSLRIFVWSPQDDSVKLHSLRSYKISRNPKKYGLFEDMR